MVLETFQDQHVRAAERHREDDHDERFVGPLVLSANTRGSLVRSVEAYAEHIRNNPHLDLGDLAWTLQFRRTQFDNSRAFFSGSTRRKLVSYMDAFVAENSQWAAAATAAAHAEKSTLALVGGGDDDPAVLGIFTGQGAQWPTMGRSLMRHSPLFRASIAGCEESLASLGGGDAPSWSLADELLAEDGASRVAQAAVSQPLCTAVQIGLVDLLRVSGVALRSVVGHSSGEIAAVYAAGIISARDAIRIAYYRGFHAALAGGPRCQQGAMMAVGLSYNAAAELCARPQFTGRVRVAAENAPTSVTLSGDVDAVDELKAELDAGKTFNRKLNVDTAYHSHHMNPCADAYLSSLEACDIQVQRPDPRCLWVSSVRGDAELVLGFDQYGNPDDDADPDEADLSVLDALKGPYWVDNLTSPVLFAPAVECSLWRAGPFDIATEVGPHPALKGPSTQVFKASLGSSLPYFSVMRRGDDEVESFSGGLGYFWQHFGAAASIDFDAYRRAFEDGTAPKDGSPRLVKGLPSYRWEHSRAYWRESRVAHNFRLQDRRVHEILGRRAVDDTPELLRWRNILRPQEFPWVRDHSFQGQTVLPGAAYVAAVVEAVKVVARDEGKSIRLVELLDVKIPRAVVLEETKSTELITTLGPIVRKPDSNGVLSANFSFSTAPADAANGAAVLRRTCTGRVEVHLYTDSSGQRQALQPPDPPPTSNLGPMDTEAFYSTLGELGINYQGSFRAIKSAVRTAGYASTTASWGAETALQNASSYSLHPAILDVGFQAVLAAFASPQTGQMWTMYLPVGIKRATVHLGSLPPHDGASKLETVSVSSARITASSAKGLEGDVQIAFGRSVGIQVEGVELQATGDPLTNKDRVLFSNTIWESDISTGIGGVVLERPVDAAADEVLLETLGRTSLFYYRALLEAISPREVKSLAWHQQMFWQSAQHWVEEVGTGRHPTVKREWLRDTREMVWEQAEACQHTVDVQITRALGEELPSIARGETQPLEVMMKNDMLSRFYIESYGLDAMNDSIARVLAQITHRHPQADILEIGAGSGGTTRKALRAMGNAFSHYTFTDISSGFFEKAAEKFSSWRHKISFKICDIEKDPVEEGGFAEESYDIIVAANVLHATRCLADTMRHVRRLLKPGGYLVMMEITGDLLRLGFIMGSLPGWWLGPQVGDEGRQWAPGISPVQWDDLLRRTGFSGIDHMATDHPEAGIAKHYVSTLVTQAVDDEFEALRSPLSAPVSPPQALSHKLVILGGATFPVARLARDVKALLAPRCAGVLLEMVSSLDDLPDPSHSDDKETVSLISLTELDAPLFASPMTATRLEKLQAVLDACESALWVTEGSRGQSPVSNMVVGIARALRTERSDINLQLLDVGDGAQDAKAAVLAEHFLKLALVKRPEYVDKRMLWTTEAELAIDGQTLLVPRLIPDKSRNERYNASRRDISKDIDLASDEVVVEIDARKGGVASLLSVESALSHRLTPRMLVSTHANAEGNIALDVHLSVALLRPEQRDPYFLCYGSVKAAGCDGSGTRAFAVSRVNRSVILCDRHDVLKLDSGRVPAPGREEAVLGALAGQLVAQSLVPSLSLLLRQKRAYGSVLVYEPPSEGIVQAIKNTSLLKDRQVFCATSSRKNSASVPSGWISVDPLALGSSTRQRLPGDVALVIDFSHALDSQSCDIESFLRTECLTRRFEPSLLVTHREALAGAYGEALVVLQQEAGTNRFDETNVLKLSSVSGSPPRALGFPSIVDWGRKGEQHQQEETITAHVRPLDPNGIFSSSKTHLMVGLNGDLGQSICAYMCRNGARHIAIASRQGEKGLPAAWLESMRREHPQASIRVYQMDVSSRPSILSALDSIRSGMPPIGGVANGALVLQDKMFLNMDVETLNQPFGPKVAGSKYLDEVFSTPGVLDYFVLFSSVGTVGGNRGQGNYHAANMFMTSLVANRRARGLAASVIHMGMVLDVGYVARQDRKLFEHMRKQGFMPTSETDAHFLWAEGVLASPPDSQLEADICMGFEPFEDNGDEAAWRPPWYHESRLSHFIMQPEGDEGLRGKAQQGVDGGDLPIRQKLDGAETVQEVHPLLQEAFSAKLESMMQLATGSTNVNVPLLDLGFDSLLAVETRTWFLKETHIDVPVLRFLGGDTVREICLDAATQYLELRAVRPGVQDHMQNLQAEQGKVDVTSANTGEKEVIQVQEDGEGRQDRDRPVSPPTSSESGAPSSSRTNMNGSSSPTSSETPQDTPDPLPTPPLKGVPTPATTFPPEQVRLDDGQARPKKAEEAGPPGIPPPTQHIAAVRPATSRVEAMSYAQCRLWFLDQYLDDKTTCNIAIAYTIKGLLDVPKLRAALDRVVAHHASLRTCFYADDETGEPMQALLRSVSSSHGPTLKCLRAPGRHQDVRVEREFNALRDHEWDLARGDTFAATLVSFEDKADEHVLIFGYHHIVIDGVSWHIILGDLERAYTSQPLSRQGTLYMDAAAEQRRAVASGAMDEDIAYWAALHARLPNTLPLLPVASSVRARGRQPLRRYDCHEVTRHVGGQLVARIKSASRAAGVTPFHFHLATTQLLFAKLLDNGIDDLCIGVADASRDDGDGGVANTAGFFLNMLPLRFRLDRNGSFADTLRATSRHVLEARSHGRVPIDVLLDRLGVPRDAASSPLFQTTFNYRVGAMAQLSLGEDCRLSVDMVRDAQGPFDLGLGVYESADDGSLGVQVAAQSRLYERDAAELLADAYVYLLGVLSADTSLTAAEYHLFDASVAQRDVHVGKGRRETWHGWPDTLSKRVSAVTRIYSEDVAVVEMQPDSALTYGDLERRVCSAAASIKGRKIPPGSNIAVLCQPSADIVVFMLAILRLGHVYVPLDTNLPPPRHAAILADCRPALLVCHHATLESMQPLAMDIEVPIVNGSVLPTAKATTVHDDREDLSDPDGAAFLFYTSGSTGKPKGIRLNHLGFLNHLALKTSALSLGQETVLQQSSFGFDMSLTQTFCALANGGTLVIAPKASRGDPIALSEMMLAHDITFTIATPSEYLMMLRHGHASSLRRCSGWTHACMGGEAVTPSLIRAFQELGIPGLQLTNCYGPTEASLAVTFNKIGTVAGGDNPNDPAAKSTTSVGTVLPNYSVYIVAEGSGPGMEPLPVGYPGEICIGGAGVALGYLNLPELSAAKFVNDPFADAQDVERGWTRVFRTGDRGSLRPDGSLVFMGRIGGSDAMVKLRGGLRVDLDDIASTIVATAGDRLSEAAVTVRGGDEDEDEAQVLVAHVVPRDDKKAGPQDWQRLMRDLPLPAYMRPSVVIAVDRLPQTPNGKIDRRRIETMDLPVVTNHHQQQQQQQKQRGGEQRKRLSLEEGELSLLWEEVLGGWTTATRAGLGPDSDFFMVGGSSLALMRLQGAIKEATGLAVPIVKLYQASTLGRMAALLHASKGQRAQDDDIDWEAEAAFDVQVSPSGLGLVGPATKETSREVVLTGAHGFLGREILRALTDDDSVRRVHCIALPRRASKTMPRSGKMVCYPGSLQSETLGLSPDDISFLRPRVDLIIHAGSVGHCLNNYSSVRAPNVGSLRFLVRELALPRRVPLHFVSSNRVALFSGKYNAPPLSVLQMEPSRPPKDGSEGLTASKWCGERLLANVALAAGLEVTVHRPCAVVGPDAPQEDALNALLRFSVAQAAVPRLGGSNLQGFLDFAPVAEVAAGIVRVALKTHQDSLGGAGGGGCIVNMASAATAAGQGDVRPVTIVHHSSGVETPVAEFRQRMEELHGIGFTELDIANWIVVAVQNGMDPLISTYLEALVEKDQAIGFPYLGQPLGK